LLFNAYWLYFFADIVGFFIFVGYKILHANFKKAFSFFLYYLWFRDFPTLDVTPDAVFSLCFYAETD